MCDVFNKFSLTYYSDVSQFSRRSRSAIQFREERSHLPGVPEDVGRRGKRRREVSLDDDYPTLATVRYCLQYYLMFVCYLVFFTI